MLRNVIFWAAQRFVELHIHYPFALGFGARSFVLLADEARLVFVHISNLSNFIVC